MPQSKNSCIGQPHLNIANVTPTAPLRLDVAARLGFPDGSMSVAALRRLVVAGKLSHEFIAGKYFVTLAGIEEMRASFRVMAKPVDAKSASNEAVLAEEPPSDMSLAYLNLLATELKEKSREERNKLKQASNPKLKRLRGLRKPS